MKFVAVNHEVNQIVRRAGLTLALFVGSFAAVEHAEAACSPATSTGAVVNGQPVDCTGATSGQNGSNGYGTGAESAVTVNVQQGASVTGDSAGIKINDGTVNNLGLGSVIEAASSGPAIRAEGGSLTVTNSADAIIRANGVSGLGIWGVSDVTLTNTGLIEATDVGGGMAVVADAFATVTNNIGGTITGGLRGISAGTIQVKGNDGTIEALGAGGSALFAGDVTVKNNATGIIRANNADATAISGNTINVTNGGKIEATGPNGIAIRPNITAMVKNLSGGTIRGGSFGILGTPAGTLDVTNDFGGLVFGNTTAIEGTGTVRNAGTISGGTASVQFTGAGTNTLILQTGSVLTGNAVGSATPGATNKLILQGNGTIRNIFSTSTRSMCRRVARGSGLPEVILSAPPRSPAERSWSRVRSPVQSLLIPAPHWQAAVLSTAMCRWRAVVRWRAPKTRWVV